MRAPDFWYRSPETPGTLARFLSPLGTLYANATKSRVARSTRYRADVPVICIGNINAGGTGKTPMVIALVQHLQARGIRPVVISKGHGGRLTGPVEVSERQHSAADVGDEPLLIAAFTRIWIAKDRAEAAKAANAAGADLIIMDDGHQNPDVAKDLSVIVVDAVKGFGNGRCIPAGPLREPIREALARANLLVSIGTKPAQKRFTKNWATQITVPYVNAEIMPLETGMDWADTPLLAFAGIGHPEKFFSTLKSLGADLVRSEALEDHQPLTKALLTRLENEASLRGAQLVTTEKDATRLPSDFRRKVLTLPVRLKVHDWTPMEELLAKVGVN